jgi:hypothetical protein
VIGDVARCVRGEKEERAVDFVDRRDAVQQSAVFDAYAKLVVVEGAKQELTA